MPSADGPCRFGQYNLLQRLVLNRLGYGDAAILSPSSRNAYQGLGFRARLNFWEAVLCGDLLYKAVCKVRPYEIQPGHTDAVAKEEVARIADLLAKRDNHREAFRQAILYHKDTGWRDISRRRVLGILKALKRLALAPVEG